MAEVRLKTTVLKRVLRYDMGKWATFYAKRTTGGKGSPCLCCIGQMPEKRPAIDFALTLSQFPAFKRYWLVLAIENPLKWENRLS
jgi:hypothetical protein